MTDRKPPISLEDGAEIDALRHQADALRAEVESLTAERDAAMSARHVDAVALRALHRRQRLADAEALELQGRVAAVTVGALDAEQRAAAAVARAEQAEALGRETTEQLKTAQYHLNTMVQAWEQVEAERDDYAAKLARARDLCDRLDSILWGRALSGEEG